MARRPLSALRPTWVGWIAWFVGVWLLLATWSLAIGRYGGPDEPAHVTRAYAVAHGDLLGSPTDEFTSGYRVVTVPSGLGTGDPACYRFDPAASDECAVRAESTSPVRVASAAGINPPLYYALVGVPVRLMLPADEVVSYRLVAAGWVAAVLALAALRLARHGTRALIGLAVLPPSVWFLFGVVNPNALEIALVALAWVCVTPVGRRLTASDWIAAGTALALAVAMRPIAAVAALAVGTVGWLLDRRDDPHRPSRFPTPQVVGFATPLSLAVAAVVAWHSWADVVISDPRTATDRSTFDALLASIGGVPRTASELVASLGWLEFWVPFVVMVGWTSLIVVIVARSRPSVGAFALWVGVLLVPPIVFEVVAADDVGLIWQGRYSLPVFVGLGAVVLSSPRLRSLPHATLPVVAIAEIATFAWTSRRYDVGTDGPWWPSFESTLLAVTHIGIVVTGYISITRWTRRAPAGPMSAEVAEHVDDHM